MTEDEKRAMFFGAFVMLIVCLVMGTVLLAFAVRANDRYWERVAVAHGAAEYVITGDKIEFKWRLEK